MSIVLVLDVSLDELVRITEFVNGQMSTAESRRLEGGRVGVWLAHPGAIA